MKEKIINDDRRKDITHLNQYIGAEIVVFFNGFPQYKGIFEGAG